MQDHTTYDDVPAFNVFDDPTLEEVQAVAKDMRYLDRREFAAWNANPQQAVTAFSTCDHKWVVYQYENPVFVFGVKQTHPGCYYIAGFGAEYISESTLRSLTRYGMKHWVDHLFYDLQVRRLEVVVPVGSSHSIEWLTKLGMKIECSCRDYVRQGDTFVRLSYTISDHEELYDYVHVQSAGPARSTADAETYECRNAGRC